MKASPKFLVNYFKHYPKKFAVLFADELTNKEVIQALKKMDKDVILNAQNDTNNKDVILIWKSK